jgi:DNA polymerase I
MNNDPQSEHRAQSGIQLDEGDGGFGTDTEVFTTRGPRPAGDVCEGDIVYALEPGTRLVKRKPITNVETRAYRGRAVSIRTRRADLLVAPEHPILFRTRADSVPRFRPAARIGDREHHRFISEWRTPSKPWLETVDLTDITGGFEACVQTDQHGHSFRAALPDGCEPTYRSQCVGYCFDATTFNAHQEALEQLGTGVGIRTGKKHRSRPYRFDGDDFIEFLAWFVTEGSVYWKDDRESATVQIAQETPRHRRAIRALLDRMALRYSETNRTFRIGSHLYGRLLTTLCGSDSREKRLPSLVWRLPDSQQELLLETLVAGDGNDRGTYYTASDRLAGDVLALALQLGIKPRYTRRRGIWNIYLNRVNDGFQTESHVTSKLLDGTLVRLTIADYPAVLAGRNGRFQWVGVNKVS